MNRQDMTLEQEREFVEQCYNEYENSGYSNTFWTPYSDFKERIGEKFEVIRRVDEREADIVCLPLWKIKFTDGLIITAHPEEIITYEIENVKKQVCSIVQ